MIKSGHKFVMTEELIQHVSSTFHVKREWIKKEFPIGTEMFVALEATIPVLRNKKMWVCYAIPNGNLCYIDEEMLK